MRGCGEARRVGRSDEVTPVEAHAVSNKKKREIRSVRIQTIDGSSARGRRSVARVEGTREIKREGGAKRLPAFRRGWVRVLIRDRGRGTQDTLRVEKRGKTGINESGFLPATDRAA